MAEYADRERNFNDSLGPTMGKFAVAMVQADSLSKDAGLHRAMQLAGMDNVEFNTKTSLIGLDQPLETRMSVPPIAIVKSNPLEIQEANMSMDMTVSASQESSSSLKSDTEVKGSGSANFGFFKVGVSMKAAVSVAKESKRKSDYRATTHADLKMVQGDTPEGLARIIDAITETVSEGLAMNKVLIEKQAEKLSAATGEADPDALTSGEEAPAA